MLPFGLHDQICVDKSQNVHRYEDMLTMLSAKTPRRAISLVSTFYAWMLLGTKMSTNTSVTKGSAILIY